MKHSSLKALFSFRKEKRKIKKLKLLETGTAKFFSNEVMINVRKFGPRHHQLNFKIKCMV